MLKKIKMRGFEKTASDGENRHTDTTMDGHGDSMTELAQGVDPVNVQKL